MRFFRPSSTSSGRRGNSSRATLLVGLVVKGASETFESKSMPVSACQGCLCWCLCPILRKPKWYADGHPCSHQTPIASPIACPPSKQRDVPQTLPSPSSLAQGSGQCGQAGHYAWPPVHHRAPVHALCSPAGCLHSAQPAAASGQGSCGFSRLPVAPRTLVRSTPLFGGATVFILNRNWHRSRLPQLEHAR